MRARGDENQITGLNITMKGSLTIFEISSNPGTENLYSLVTAGDFLQT
jgi:hypothetical protein